MLVGGGGGDCDNNMSIVVGNITTTRTSIEPRYHLLQRPSGNAKVVQL